MQTASLTPLVGFRAWRATAEHELRPLAHYSLAAWNDGPRAAAVCRLSAHAAVDARGGEVAHEAPHWSCTCGIHAYYAPGWTRVPYAGLVYGAILAWGRIVEHERGFRAERAEIIALAEGPNARPVADRYELPVLPSAELLQYAGWWGEVKTMSVEQAA
jgi:hypothetical protein